MTDAIQASPTILDKFYEYEQSRSGSLFLSEPVNRTARTFTWGQAGDEIRRMATALRSMQFPPQSRIAILGKNSAHWIMADLAIMMAGFVSVPLYPTISHSTLASILKHSDAKAIFIGKLDQYEELVPAIVASISKIGFPFYPKEDCLSWNELIKEHSPMPGKPSPDPASLACILYTSGTTGEPKGVMHSYQAHTYSLLTVFEALGNDFNAELFFSYLPLCHVAERMVVEYAGVFCGGTIYFPESPETFSKNLVEVQPTVFLAVPRIWEKFREEILKKISQKWLNRLLSVPWLATALKKILKKKLGLSRARYILTGASPIKASLLFWFAKLGIIIQEAYGMTENMALSHINRKATARFGTVGQSYPGVEVRLGKDNEVQVKSAASMMGYFKEPALTAQSFEEDFLKTGDEGFIDKDGFLTITGRIKDQFKTSKGKYIAPAPIEKMLLEYPQVAQVCVVGSGLSHPLALCVPASGISSTDKAQMAVLLHGMLQQVNAQLEHHEKLARLVIVSEEWTVLNGLLTPTLKIKRNRIDSFYGQHYSRWLHAKEDIVFC